MIAQWQVLGTYTTLGKKPEVPQCPFFEFLFHKKHFSMKLLKNDHKSNFIILTYKPSQQCCSSPLALLQKSSECCSQPQIFHVDCRFSAMSWICETSLFWNMLKISDYVVSDYKTPIYTMTTIAETVNSSWAMLNRWDAPESDSETSESGGSGISESSSSGSSSSYGRSHVVNTMRNLTLNQLLCMEAGNDTDTWQ